MTSIMTGLTEKLPGVKDPAEIGKNMMQKIKKC